MKFSFPTSASRCRNQLQIWFIVVTLLWSNTAHACWVTWVSDQRPNSFATKHDLDACVSEKWASFDGATYHVRDLHGKDGYDAVYVPALSANGQEQLGTIARSAIHSYYVLVDVQRPPKTQIEYRDRTVTVPVERVVERTTPAPALPALASEPSAGHLWNGQQPYSFISDGVMTQLRGTGNVISKGAGNDEVISIPCLTDAEATRRLAYYGRSAAQFAGSAEPLNPYWVLLTVATPPTVEVHDREVQVPVDRPVPEPNPLRLFLEGNMTRIVVLTILLLGFLLIVLPHVHYQLHLRKTMLNRMFPLPKRRF
jgi:hypothetical protein